MITPSLLRSWRDVAARLCAGPVPRGAEFDVARQVVAAAADRAAAETAMRMLLEGAVADAQTGIADVQTVMAVLKAIDRRELRLADLLPGP
ncbi:MAG TPA: hypothetical protein P5234_10615 [Thermoanaerobaculaceae bacterium]|nr:hypothetical protein [Thermoanaerobaculaceae bacterium]HRS16681.1 hypothetical protein [Thermoanaerobaculaceae bacterium]